MLESLAGVRPRLADPDSRGSEQPAYAINRFRAREDHPEILVFIAICTHLGCVPGYHPAAGGDLGSDWPGGFFCPCHGSRYDLAARVFRGQPAPRNMAVPPYRYVSDTRLAIGEDEVG
jgi:ubiquinol-cytochrome c reductase iron-sulfur subunit